MPMVTPPLGRARARLGKVVGRDARLSASAHNLGEDLSKLTVVELKDRLRKVDLTVGGMKKELIERLNGYYLSQSPIESCTEKSLMLLFRLN